MSDPFDKLLRQAETQPRLRDPGELAAAVLRISRRRKRMSRSIAVTAAMIVSAIAVDVMTPSRHPTPPPIAQLPATRSQQPTLAEIQLQISAGQKLLDELEAMDCLSGPDGSHAQRNTKSALDPTDYAAAAVVLQADRMRDAGLRPQAAAAYSRAVTDFPESPWAQTASERLKSLDAKG